MDIFDMLGILSSLGKDFLPSTPIERTAVDKYIVSTVKTVDMGLETAILDEDGAYPVERYLSMEDAKEGHKKWVKFIEDGNTTITELAYGAIESREVKLK